MNISQLLLWCTSIRTMFSRVRRRGGACTLRICCSHMCQSSLSITGRRKSEWEMQQFAVEELLAYVGLVGLSLHVQRQPLSDSLSTGWWAWALRTEGLWHRVYQQACTRYYVLPFSCVSMHMLLVWSVWCCWAVGFLGASRAPLLSFVTER